MKNAKDFSELARKQRSEERNVPAYLSTTATEADTVNAEKDEHGELAQLGEHLPCTQGVKGSSPLFSTICMSNAQWSIDVKKLHSTKVQKYLEN